MAQAVGAFVMVVGSTTTFAAIIHVDDSATGANTGMSWADAYVDLHDALSTALNGDEIRIAQGMYKPAGPGGDRAISFELVSGITIQGGYAGAAAPPGVDPDTLDPALYVTTLSGDLNGDDGPNFQNYADNTFHIVAANNVFGATLRGLTITAGHAAPPPDELEPVQGGGIHATDSELAIVDCRFIANRVQYFGGGLYAEGGFVSVDQSEFIGNRTLSFGRGAGIMATQCSIEDSQFEDNSAFVGEGGGVWAGLDSRIERCQFINNGADCGGGVHIENSAVLDCLFFSNGAGAYGGGLRNVGVSQVLNCRFIGNGSAECGGAVYNPGGSLTLINCTLSGNSSSHSGGAIRSDDDLTIINCTITGNGFTFSGALAGAGIYADGSFTAINSILWDNVAKGPVVQDHQLELGPDASAAISHCTIMGWNHTMDGDANHGNQPHFVNAMGPDGEYGTMDDDPHLRPNSLCIDTGDAMLLPSDDLDCDGDGDTGETLPHDADGLPRIVHATVDRGAYEFQEAPCSADIDGSGSVDGADLLAITSAWGQCPAESPCNADLNLDSNVAVRDLLMVVSAWGACP